MMRRRVRPILLLVLAFPFGGQSQPAYVDQVLEDGPQPALVMAPSLGSAGGWPRSLRVDYSLARDNGAFAGASTGLAVLAHVDTPNHGALSLNAALSGTRVDHDGSTSWDKSRLWRIDQIGLPLDRGWQANHSAGDLSWLQVPMTRSFGRFGLPSSQLQGATAQYQRGQETQYNLSMGRPGAYAGLGVSGFEPGQGRLLLAGVQQALGPLSPGSTIALQWAQASDIAERAGGPSTSSRSAWAAWRWQGQAPWADALAPGPLLSYQRQGGLELQANAIRSQRPEGGSASGAWLDARWRSRWLDQTAGVFHLDPGLRWGTYEAASDLRGVYWRGELTARQWYLSTSAEWTSSVSGRSTGDGFASITSRYRVDTRNTLTGGLSVRGGQASGQSVQLGWDRSSAWGQTQWQINFLNGASRRAARVGVDHSLQIANHSNLGFSVGFERSEELGSKVDALGWALIASTRPWSSVTLDANLRGSNSSQARQLHSSVGVGWTLNPSWSLLAQWSQTRGVDLRPVAVLSPISEATALALAPQLSTRRMQLTLRYQEAAGQASAPLGGTPGMGAGTVSGHVYFDGNDNGRRDASEAGVPDVVIRLDGRFIARTDAQGRYEYPAVAPGPHRLEVIADNVPLPWSPTLTGPQPVEVRVRDLTLRDFPVRHEP
jgi:hypothetical protein